MGPKILLGNNKHFFEKGGFLKTCQLHNGRLSDI